MTPNTVSTKPTPQERLANSRKAIVRHMGRDSQAEKNGYNENSFGFDDAEQSRVAAAAAAGGTWGRVRQAMLAWWRHHPGSVAFDLAKPVIGRYAREQPFKLLGIAAGVGAAAVVLRPWRLISLGGVLLATLKSSQLSSVVLSLLSTPQENVDVKTRHEPQ